MILADDLITNDEKNTLKKYSRKFELREENIDKLLEYPFDGVKKEISKKGIINQLSL